MNNDTNNTSFSEQPTHLLARTDFETTDKASLKYRNSRLFILLVYVIWVVAILTVVVIDHSIDIWQQTLLIALCVFTSIILLVDLFLPAYWSINPEYKFSTLLNYFFVNFCIFLHNVTFYNEGIKRNILFLILFIGVVYLGALFILNQTDTSKPKGIFVTSLAPIGIWSIACWVILKYESNYSDFIDVITIYILYVATTSQFFLNNQKAALRYLFRHMRQDRLLSRVSPYVQPRNPFTKFQDVWLPRYFSLENRSLSLISCFILGGILFPIFLHHVVNLSQQPRNDTLDQIFGIDFWYLSPLQLMLVGLVTTAILLLVYSVWYVAQKRDRYIVTEFSSYTASSTDEPQMKKVASTVRRMLINELQEVGALLKQRQVENVHFVREDANAIFMTSGFEGELFEQIQQVVTVDFGNTGSSVDVGRFSMFVARVLARIRINGGAQRHDNGGIEIFVEMRYRNRVTPMIKTTFRPSVNGENVDDALIKVQIREIALTLLISLGQVPGVGDSWRALDYFLQGLAANGKQNWWLAISNYYRALEADGETTPQKLGVIYYHLGSALIYQGNWKQGREMLQKAEAYGPAMAVTHYMLAFTALYTYWGYLNKSEVIFNEIEYRCKRALRMRRDFPEAHQLLGMTYYRRARIIDRDENSKNTLEENFYQDYDHAASYYRRALIGYDRSLAQARRKISVIGLGATDMESLARQRIIAGHQLGDSLRGSGYFAEADQFYEDMLVSQRTNIRNIADMLKNYCLGQSWQRGQEFLYQVANRHEAARWDADVAIHAGWLLSAGAFEIKSNKTLQEKLARKAFQHIDYAIYARPRTAKSWRQTDWEKAFNDLCNQFPIKGIGDKRTIEIYELKVAIQWRKHIIDSANSTKEINFHTFPSIYRQYINDYTNRYIVLVAQITELESQLIKEEQFSDVITYFKQSTLAHQAYTLWKEMNKAYDEGTFLKDTLTFSGRLKLDSYIQVSLLCARMLAETQRFEPLAFMTKTVCKQLADHREEWEKNYKSDNVKDGEESHMTFSPIVFSYQYASLRAWNAFALLRRDSDPVSKCVSEVIKSQYSGLPEFGGDSLRIARKQIDDAYKELPVHPLVMFVRAQLMGFDQLYPQAIQQLKALLDVIEPFDPKSDIGMTSGDIPSPSATTNPDREKRYHMERVIGRQQFHNIVNPVAIYELMAEYAQAIGQPVRAVAYLNDAVRRSKFDDRDFTLFEKLGAQLSNLERYTDAMAIAHAMKTPRELITIKSMLGVHQLAPEILEIEVLTRQGDYLNARRLARRMAGNFQLKVDRPYQNNISTETDTNEIMYKFNKEFINFYVKNRAGSDKLHERALSRFNEILQTKIPTNISFAQGLNEIILFMSQKYQLGLETDKGIQFSPMFAQINEFECGFSSEDKEPIHPEFYYRNPSISNSKNDPTSALKNLSRRLFTYKASKEQNDLYCALNHLAERTLYLDRQDLLKNLLEKQISLYSADDFKLAEFTRVVMYRGEQARSTLIYLSDIWNSLAYSSIMLGRTEPNFAFADAAAAVYVLNFLYQTCDQTEPMRTLLARKLAQACDTYAWVEYLSARPTLQILTKTFEEDSKQIQSTLAKVEHVLRQGLRYDASRAVIRYHLAHIYLDGIELLLNLIEAQSYMQPLYSSLSLEKYFEKAEIEIEHAQDNDRNNRLSFEIDHLKAWYSELKNRSSLL